MNSPEHVGIVAKVKPIIDNLWLMIEQKSLPQKVNQ